MFKKKLLIAFIISILVLSIFITHHFQNNDQNNDNVVNIKENLNIKVNRLDNNKDIYSLILEVKNNKKIHIENLDMYISFPISNKDTNTSSFSDQNPRIKFNKKIDFKKDKTLFLVGIVKKEMANNIDYEHPVIFINYFYKNNNVNYKIDLNEILKK